MNLTNYFAIQERYYNYLHEKLGDRFQGDPKKGNNGMVKTGCYHQRGWEYLSTIEGQGGFFRMIAIHCINGESVLIKFRDGDKYHKDLVTPESFPKMSRRDDRFLWNCNEIISVQLHNQSENDKRSVATKDQSGN